MKARGIASREKKKSKPNKIIVFKSTTLPSPSRT